MKKRTNIILQTIIILLSVLFSGTIDNSYNDIWLAFIYTFVYISISALSEKTPFFTFILISIMLDSIYGMTLGFSALVFIVFAFLIKIKNHYIKQLGSFFSHSIFFISLGIVAILSLMSKYILDMHFVNIGYYLLFSTIFYPFIYFIIQILFNNFVNNEK